jgi:hypothetical protein
MEHFLVVLRPGASPLTTHLVIDCIQGSGGQVVMVAGRGNALVVTIESRLAEALRKMPAVAHVGGIKFNQRPVKRIRISA